ncbi:nitroreductase family protein [Cytobacillus kochii]|uniref:Nitroreductase domain-containing protein n=1 Tax=Cytobacillus kochii TaxID=859143 RepID=A0A248TPT5_9BACI|nr:SagB/ThcOx family dehydrogenase [Cytobacillus kochii]ASV70207.1 hypothetical protein CKF48_23265 [Cytobacillus kochii]
MSREKNKYVNSKINALQFQKNQSAEILEEVLISPEKFNKVSKFHQDTTWTRAYEWNGSYTLEEWLKIVEMTDVLPEYFEERISFPNIQKRFREASTSHRKFLKDVIIRKDLLGQILYDSFGRAEGIPTKNYPSAGGLYPIIPLILIFSVQAAEGISKKGSYVYDSSSGELLLLKEFSNEDIVTIESNVGEIYSNIAVGYSMDIRRAIAKYGYRGYRHALIEVGAMSQSIRSNLKQIDHGDFLLSGFSDNSLTKMVGLSPRLTPLIILQWFGIKA